MIVENRCETDGGDLPVSLPMLAKRYAAMDETLQQFASASPFSLDAELTASNAVSRLLSSQRRMLEAAAEKDAQSIGDMVAKLEIWRAESVDCEEDRIGSTDRLVLSVLEALKRYS